MGCEMPWIPPTSNDFAPPFSDSNQGLPGRQAALFAHLNPPMKSTLLKSSSMLFWGVTAYLAGYEIFITRTLVSTLFLMALDRFAVRISVLEKIGATGIGNIASLLMAILAIAIIVGGFDFHWSYGGTKRSFKVLLITLVLQFAYLCIYSWIT